jgi:putative component of toxin-antitoxin plasmid stabilization module
MKRYEIETYVTDTGACPFDDWRRSLKDAKAKLAIMARIERATTPRVTLATGRA